MLTHDSITRFQLAIGNSYNKTFIVNNDSRERLTTFIYEWIKLLLTRFECCANAWFKHEIPTRDWKPHITKTFIMNNDSRERLTTFIYEWIKLLLTRFECFANAWFQHKIPARDWKPHITNVIVNNDSGERLTTLIYEEKHVFLQGLNVVLMHDSNTRFPLAIGNLK